ncbi:putative mediator of RNA polymerase II transcription subunit 26 isoform X1 [Neoarius graeffei]|nr:putative mediator of RNA polymerase II transcription subunit 26 isoform X1 [Neoarius graeffei]XP_060758618.1 putative mediator of RNA polymerase II transcription subunit 26 isoform X1 [Neoarius graeffei]
MNTGLCWLRALLLLALCLCFGGAERDPLPVALAELMKSGSVSSTEDLQLLLLSDSVDDDSESEHANNTNNRLPRSLLDAQPAQQAQCKVRTEVMEVTRSMLDRNNANFLLWPPCVEVQRCSGCCNTKNLKCVAVLTHTRYLQVMKIQYMNMRPVYNKAVVSVNDHVECRCQPAPRPASRRKSPARKQEARDRSGKPRYKDELHRRDELKPNQRLKLEDLLSHSWLPLENGQDAWSHNKTHHGKNRGHSLGDGRKYNSSSNSTNGWSSERLTNPLPNHIKTEDTGLLLHNVTRAREKMREKEVKDMETQKNSTINDDRLSNQSLVNGVNPTEITNQIPQHESELIQCSGHSKSAESSQVHRNETTSQIETSQNQMHSEAHVGQTNQTMVPKPAEKTNQKQGHAFNAENEPSTRINGNETPETESTQEETEETRSRSTLLKERKALEEEKEELLLLHKRLDEEKHKHFLKAQQHSQHEDQKQHQPHHKPQQTHTTTQRTESKTTTPVRVATPHTHTRLPHRPRKRLRKHRNRISKAVMRAMLM